MNTPQTPEQDPQDRHEEHDQQDSRDQQDPQDRRDQQDPQDRRDRQDDSTRALEQEAHASSEGTAHTATDAGPDTTAPYAAASPESPWSTPATSAVTPEPVVTQLPRPTGPHAPAIVLGVICLAIAGLVIAQEVGELKVDWGDVGPLGIVAAGALLVLFGLLGLLTSRRNQS